MGEVEVENPLEDQEERENQEMRTARKEEEVEAGDEVVEVIAAIDRGT